MNKRELKLQGLTGLKAYLVEQITKIQEGLKSEDCDPIALCNTIDSANKDINRIDNPYYVHTTSRMRLTSNVDSKLNTHPLVAYFLYFKSVFEIG